MGKLNHKIWNTGRLFMVSQQGYLANSII